MEKEKNITRRVFLDWASSALPLPESLESFIEISKSFYGNPSSIHAEGREAKEKLEKSRLILASALDADREEIIFTSSATEANQLVYANFIYNYLANPNKKKNPRLLVSEIEHASVWEPLKVLAKLGFEIVSFKPKADGVVDPKTLAELLTEETCLVSLMLVNNETGAIQPLAESVRLVKAFASQIRRKIHFHCDAAQAFGKIFVSFRQLELDSLAISSHKIGGLRGVGALLLKKGLKFNPLLPGGGQEKNIRSGTENLAAICSFVEAASLRLKNLEKNWAYCQKLMAKLLTGLLKLKNTIVIPAERLKDPNSSSLYSPYILSLAFPPIPAEVLVRHLDEAGFAVSSGSACHSARKKTNRVLLALGVKKEIYNSAIRVSISPENTEEEIDAFIEALIDLVPYLTKLSLK